MRRAVQALVLLQAVAGLRVDLHSGLSRRAAIGAGVAFAASATSADAASITDNIRDSLAKPGFKIEYEEFMDRDSGDIRSMPTGVEGDPLAGPVLLFGALATRFGGWQCEWVCTGTRITPRAMGMTPGWQATQISVSAELAKGRRPTGTCHRPWDRYTAAVDIYCVRPGVEPIWGASARSEWRAALQRVR